MSGESIKVREIIDAWPSLTTFATDVGIGYEAAKQMRRRSSIAVTHWTRVIESAARRGIPGITYEALGRAHAIEVQAAS